MHVDIVVRLRSLVYAKLQRLSFRFFDQSESGTLINRVTRDVQAVRMFIDGVVVQSFIMLISLAVYLVYMLNIHPRLTLACLATTPLLWLVTAMFSRTVRPAYEENLRRMDNMVLAYSECIQGIATIKGFGLEKFSLNKFRKTNMAVRDQRQSIFWKTSIFSPLINFLTQVNLIILLGYGGWLVTQGQLPIGTGLVVFAGLLQQFSGQIANLSGVVDRMQQSFSGARRVFEVLDAPVEVKSKTQAVSLPRARGAVKFEHVHFEFKKRDLVLEDIDFEAGPGEVVAIAGATGSGKSALMSLIPRFYDPSRGRVLLDGHDLRDLRLEDLRRNIGLVFQENFLFSNTIAFNIAFGQPDARREQIVKAAKIAAAHAFIKELPEGYDTVLGEGGVNLSGGQRQRLAIARAVLLEPSVILMDDPTAAIDPETEHEILEAIENAIEGRATFIVAHRLCTLRRADRVIVLERGRIAQMGTHDELLRQKGPYRKAVTIQSIDPVSMKLLKESRQRKEGKL